MEKHDDAKGEVLSPEEMKKTKGGLGVSAVADKLPKLPVLEEELVAEPNLKG